MNIVAPKTYQQPASLSSLRRPSPSRAASPIQTWSCFSSADGKYGQHAHSRNIDGAQFRAQTYLIGHLLLVGLTSLISLIASSHRRMLLCVRDCFRYSSKFSLPAWLVVVRVEAENLSAIFLNSLSHHGVFRKDRRHKAEVCT